MVAIHRAEVPRAHPAIFGEECCRLLGVLVVAHADILPTHLDLSDLGGGGRGCLLVIERGDTCLHIGLEHTTAGA